MPAVRRRHRPGCRHCAMVELYHLERDTKIREREVAGGDEELFIPHFAWWLTHYEWEREPQG